MITAVYELQVAQSPVKLSCSRRTPHVGRGLGDKPILSFSGAICNTNVVGDVVGDIVGLVVCDVVGDIVGLVVGDVVGDV
jgi:tetrahydromethanopterin S-methyltransferase subunit C